MGKLFDEICDEAEHGGNLIILEGFENDEEKAYSAVTTEIIKWAETLKKNSADEEISAVIVWEGKGKYEKDETAAFAENAKKRNIEVKEILTI